MADEPTLFDTRAAARATDPETSWDAARSIAPETLRETQKAVLWFLRLHGPMTDEQLVRHATWEQSPSGLRTRRKELVDLGLVVDSGQREILASGRKGIVWKAEA